MIEHRLYELEKWENGEIVERLVLLIPPRYAIMYALKGYEVFDYTESLGMEPEYYDYSEVQEIFNGR